MAHAPAPGAVGFRNTTVLDHHGDLGGELCEESGLLDGRIAATDDGDLLPPAEIPNGARGPSAHDKGLLSKLFGTP